MGTSLFSETAKSSWKFTASLFSCSSFSCFSNLFSCLSIPQPPLPPPISPLTNQICVKLAWDCATTSKLHICRKLAQEIITRMLVYVCKSSSFFCNSVLSAKNSVIPWQSFQGNAVCFNVSIPQQNQLSASNRNRVTYEKMQLLFLFLVFRWKHFLPS